MFLNRINWSMMCTVTMINKHVAPKGVCHGWERLVTILFPHCRCLLRWQSIGSRPETSRGDAFVLLLVSEKFSFDFMPGPRSSSNATLAAGVLAPWISLLGTWWGVGSRTFRHWDQCLSTWTEWGDSSLSTASPADSSWSLFSTNSPTGISGSMYSLPWNLNPPSKHQCGLSWWKVSTIFTARTHVESSI